MKLAFYLKWCPSIITLHEDVYEDGLRASDMLMVRVSTFDLKQPFIRSTNVNVEQQFEENLAEQGNKICGMLGRVKVWDVGTRGASRLADDPCALTQASSKSCPDITPSDRRLSHEEAAVYG
ncbi:hypothetical protein Q8A67_003021 [Cirrhinus molitorella]|uniref:Uncharacterized protein n=1 Tax=Cirrhinus molitorella TaxID=172907 RepID=A0AA88Q4B8_9TELE|nr:hypothetical protein Q8A67_003021 [Cirrhinus molitorella]